MQLVDDENVRRMIMLIVMTTINTTFSLAFTSISISH